MKYIIATIYQSIKGRRPDGTPYFNTRLTVATAAVIHTLQLLLILRWRLSWNLMPNSKSGFILLCVNFVIVIMIALNYLYPYEEINNIEVKPSHVKLMSYGFLLYFFFNIALLANLLLI